MAIDFDNIGNVRNYRDEQRRVTSQGLVINPSLVLKMYSMLKETSPHFSPRALRRSNHFLQQEIRDGRLEPLLGMGFAILSEDTLNVARWGWTAESPIVVKNKLYEHDFRSENGKTTELDIGKEGPFCIWELGIVGYEREAWRRYLDSERTNQDKAHYLFDMPLIELN